MSKQKLSRKSSDPSQITSGSSKSKSPKRHRPQSNFLAPSDHTLFLESNLPHETEKQISNIMGWRLPRCEIDSGSEADDTFEDNLELQDGKTVAFEDEVKPSRRKKSRQAKGRRSVRPLSEREGGISPKEQMKMGKSYASFFQRIDNMDTSDEDDLTIKLCDGLRTWLKFGMNITGNQDVSMIHKSYNNKCCKNDDR